MADQALYTAIEGGDIQKVEMLISKYPQLLEFIDDEGRNGFYYSIEMGNTPVALYLLSKGMSVSCKSTENWTPLHLAASKGNIQIVRAILDKGGSITEVTFDGLNSLHVAAYYGNTEVLNELIERGAEINAVGGRSRWTALHLSTVNGHLSAVKFLLDKGADINSVKRPQGSCLHLAIKEKHIPIISMLLKRGIDLDIKDARGRKAVELIETDDVIRTIVENHIKLKQEEEKERLTKSVELDSDYSDEFEKELLRKSNPTNPSPTFASAVNSDHIIMNSIVNNETIKEINTTNNKRSTKMFINDNVSNSNIAVPQNVASENKGVVPQLKAIQSDGELQRSRGISFNSTQPNKNNRSVDGLLSRNRSSTLSDNSDSENQKTPNRAPNLNPNRAPNPNPPPNQIRNNNNNNGNKLPPIPPPRGGRGRGRGGPLGKNPSEPSNLQVQNNNPFRKPVAIPQNESQNGGLEERRAKATTWVRSDSSSKSRIVANSHRTVFLSKEDQQEYNELASIEQALENIQKNRESKRISKIVLQNNITNVASTNSDSELIKQLRRKSVRPELLNVEYSDDAPPLWGNSPLMESNELPDTIDENQSNEEDNQNIDSNEKLIVSGNNIVAYPGADKVVHDEEMVWSWLSKVAGVVIDAQAQEALEHILRLLNTLFHDREKNRAIDALLSLSLVAMKYNNKPIVSDFPVTTEEIEIGSYYFKFAAAAYGWKMLNPLMFSNKQARILFQGFTVGDPMNRKALCEHTGIKMEDIKADKWTSSDYHPAHYIAVDHKTTSIVISIRGSFHVKDALVDLIASASPFKNGFAHTGMLECARRKLEAIQLVLNETFDEFPTYKVVVVGHSLGAGTASLLTLLLKDEYPMKEFKCYAFAPPCVLSAELALSCKNIITSYALGDDCVPRLSFGSIELLKNLTVKIMNQTKSTMKLLLLIKRGKIDPNVLRNDIITSVEDRLLPPGVVYQILKESKQRWIPSEELPKCYRMEQSNPTFFSELIVSSSMFSDHLPWNYHAAFQGMQLRDQLYKKFMENPGEVEVQEKKSFFSTFRTRGNTPRR